MTLDNIKAVVAAYLGKVSGDLTVNTIDLALVALNQVRQKAELENDFEFSRRLLSVSVSSATGGSLESTVLFGTNTAASVKTVLDCGLVDSQGNLRPVEWTTVGDSLDRLRQDNMSFNIARYATDSLQGGAIGQQRFVFSGSNVYIFPKPTTVTTYTLAVEAYTFTPDWASGDLIAEDTANAPWTTRGVQYLQWATIVHINNLFKQFVFRQEGNLPPPEKLAQEALQALIDWDMFKFEAYRRRDK